MNLRQEQTQSLNVEIRELIEAWQDFRYHKREANHAWSRVRSICRRHRVDLRKPIVLALLVLFAGCKTAVPPSPTPPVPRLPLRSPKHAESVAVVPVIPSLTGIVTWIAVPGRDYNLETSVDMENWTVLASNALPPVNVGKLTDKQRFYRVGARWHVE